MNESYAEERWAENFTRTPVRKDFLNSVIKSFNEVGYKYVKETKYAKFNNKYTLRILNHKDWDNAQTFITQIADEKGFQWSYSVEKPFFLGSTSIEKITVFTSKGVSTAYDIFELIFVND